MKSNTWILLIAVPIGILLIVLLMSNKNSIDGVGDGAQNTSNSDSADEVTEQVETPQATSSPDLNIDPARKYFVTLKTTEGDIKVELNSAQTPVTANNFVTLAQKGFYDGTIFHRVMKEFMIQGGDPRGDGTGGPGYKFDDESFEGDYTRGTIAMANSGPNTNGSQFFIMHKDKPLPKQYIIFGKVIEGIEVVDKIAEAEVRQSRSGELSQPVSPVKVVSTVVVEE